MFCRNHFVVSAIHVNPLAIIWLDQIHRHDGSLVAIPSEPDLIQMFRPGHFLSQTLMQIKKTG